MMITQSLTCITLVGFGALTGLGSQFSNHTPGKHLAHGDLTSEEPESLGYLSIVHSDDK